MTPVVAACDHAAMSIAAPPSNDPRIDRRPPAVLLMGPTASGKTATALRWARRGRFGLVSADSALVYRGMDIGTAKPSPAEQAECPHHLVDIRDPHEPYSAAEFAQDATRAMHALTAAGQVPVLVGGTGLYLRALLGGLSPMPAADPAVRAVLEADAAARGWPALHVELARVDPAAAARIRPNDPQRIQRALEVYRLTGVPISTLQAAPGPRAPFRVLKLVVCPLGREVLHARIAQRFDQMLQQGFLDEVRRLAADPRLHPDVPSMRAVGYRQALEHLAGRTDAAGFRAAGIHATRQLAKRQRTWLRREFDARWFDPDDVAGLDAALAAFLGRG